MQIAQGAISPRLSPGSRWGIYLMYIVQSAINFVPHHYALDSRIIGRFCSSFITRYYISLHVKRFKILMSRSSRSMIRGDTLNRITLIPLCGRKRASILSSVSLDPRRFFVHARANVVIIARIRSYDLITARLHSQLLPILVLYFVAAHSPKLFRTIICFARIKLFFRRPSVA